MSNFSAGGPKRQADPFRVQDLAALHSVLIDPLQDSWNRLLSGMVLLAVYSRSRWSDLQQAETCVLDTDELGVLSYIELRISDHKTKHSSAFKNCFLHACAPALGITEDPWIEEWVKVREQLGVSFDKGHPTMPAPQNDGTPGTRPLSSEEMKQWTHLLLTMSDVDFSDRRITSHSCKCTLLSWASKRGMPWEDRMVLGGHTTGFKSAMIYSRDSLGRPLRMLEQLLHEVRNHLFFPDASRSGRFPKRSQASGMNNPADDLAFEQFETPIEPFSVMPTAFDTGFGSEASTGRQAVTECKSEEVPADWEKITDDAVVDLVSSDSDRSSVNTTSSSSDEEAAEHSGARRPVRPPQVPAELKLVQHRKWKTLHLMEMQNERILLCGRVADPDRYTRIHESRFDTPCCHMCWRRLPEYQ
eukprot:s1948_g37.t1